MRAPKARSLSSRPAAFEHQSRIPGFESKTGHKVKATFGSGGGTKQQVARGEAFDVPIVQPPYQDVLALSKVVVASATQLASVALGVAVRKGAPKPDISTPEQSNVCCWRRGRFPIGRLTREAAGVSFNETLKQLGIAGQLQPNIKLAQGAPR